MTTSMVELKTNKQTKKQKTKQSHAQKLTQNGEPERFTWACRRRRRRRSSSSSSSSRRCRVCFSGSERLTTRATRRYLSRAEAHTPAADCAEYQLLPSTPSPLFLPPPPPQLPLTPPPTPLPPSRPHSPAEDSN